MAQRPTEARHPSSVGLHLAEGNEALARLLEAQLGAVAAVRAAIPALESAARLAADALRMGGKLGYAGAGSSGLMALADCLELSGTFGLSPDRTPLMFAGGAAALLHMRGSVEDDEEQARLDLGAAAMDRGDCLLCLSASGSTPYTLAVAEAARIAGVAVIGIANVPGSPLLALADLPILLETGPEVVNGSTRMGAASAQKVALNMLSVRIALLLGHIHDGYMVNVIADNAKLRARAAQIVEALSGRPAETAAEALVRASQDVKTAVLVARGLPPDVARDCLRRSDGHLAPHLE